MKQANLTLHNSQQGIALITVVMILIMISIIAAISMRVSFLNQGISKNAQAKKLLQQSSDVPLSFISQPDANGEMATMMGAVGPFGMLKRPDNISKEYVLCYQPMVRDTLFDANNHLILSAGSPLLGTNDNFCKIGGTNSPFTSSRKVVLTQVSITRPGTNGNFDRVPIKPFEVSQEGTDTGSNSRAKIPKPVYYRTYSTSVIPNMAAEASNTAINECLQKPIGGQADPNSENNLKGCLEALDVPMNIKVQDMIHRAKISK